MDSYNEQVSAAITRDRALMAPLKQELATRRRYANLNSAQEADKIDALKQVGSIDPKQLTNKADSIAYSLNRWRYVAADAQKNHPDKLDTIARNYYERELAPFYKELGIPEALTPEMWQQQAYQEHGALAYRVEDSYHGGVVTGLARGLRSTEAQMETFAKTLTNMLGLELHHNTTISDLIAHKGEGFFQRAQRKTQELGDMSVYDREKGLDPGMRLTGALLSGISKTLQHYEDQDNFWSHVLPAKGFTDTAVSTTTELVATLPMFGAVRGGERALLEGGTAILGTTARGTRVVNALTEVLNATSKGKLVARTLEAGGEGLGYGILTRPNEDKNKAAIDMLSFMVGENVFHFAGQKLKLRDVLKKSGSLDALLDHDAAQAELKRSAVEGVHSASPAERRQAYIAKHASDMAVKGKEGVRQDYRDASEELLSEEAEAPESVEARHKAARENDPAKAVPLQVAKGFIKDMLNGRKISSLTREELIELDGQISDLLDEAEEHLNRTSEPIKNANAAHAEPAKGGPNATITLEHLKTTVQQEFEEEGLAAAVTPEDVENEANRRYQAAQAKGAGIAEHEQNSNAHEKAMDVAETRTENDKQIEKSGQKTRRKSKATTGKATSGEARFTPTNTKWVYLNTKFNAHLVKAIGGPVSDEGLAKFYDGMDPEDFEKELEEWMYPKAMKDAGLYFEHDHTIMGKQNPNFLAFMLNFSDQMPPAMAKKLSEELEESVRFEQHFDKSRITDTQKWHYALQMYNHVDVFLQSSAYLIRGEKNIFSSTQSNLLNPTVYQNQLLGEMHAENLKLLTQMFQGKKEYAAAATAYKCLAGDLNELFARKPSLATAQQFRSKMDMVADSFSKWEDSTYAPRERWTF